MVKRASWLSVTPEPERELPGAVATLRLGARAGTDAVADEADRVERAIDQKRQLYGSSDSWFSEVMAFFRGLPGVDLMPPTKIQQISLPELTINYNFKDVPRYDRCTTCHQGIDKLGYDKDAKGKPMPKVFASHPHLTDGATTAFVDGSMTDSRDPRRSDTQRRPRQNIASSGSAPTPMRLMIFPEPRSIRVTV